MACKELPCKSSSSHSSSSESFNLETKYIVLNFLGQNPHERHPGCVYSSTASSAASDHNPFPFRKSHNSLPTSPRKQSKRQKLGQLDASLRSSEDNVNYKYHKEQNKVQHSTNSTKSSNNSDDVSEKYKPLKTRSAGRLIDKKHSKSLSLDHGLNQGRYFLESDNSPVTDIENQCVSASTPFLNYRRTESELSSDIGNLSYTSDADDEYESTTSSLFSSFTDGGQGGRPDIFGSHRLTTLYSESDAETDLSTVAGDTSNVAQNDESVGHDQKGDLVFDGPGDEKNLPKESEANSSNVAESSSMTINITSSESMTGRSADRSKLRLVIRDQCEWEEEQRNQYRQVLRTVEDEVNTQMLFLESEVNEAVRRHIITPQESPFVAPLSPHTEAAITLARIGDEIKDYYADHLTNAVASLCTEEDPAITYEEFRNVACSVIDQVLPGWRQIALLLVYGQSVAWRVVEFGHQVFGDLVNNTARLISELYSEYITSQGGWGAVMVYESSVSSSHSQTSPEVSLSPPLDQSDHSTGSVDNQDQSKSPDNHMTVVEGHVTSSDEAIGQVAEDIPTVNQSAISLGDIKMTFQSSGDHIDNQNKHESRIGIEDFVNLDPDPGEYCTDECNNRLPKEYHDNHIEVNVCHDQNQNYHTTEDCSSVNSIDISSQPSGIVVPDHPSIENGAQNQNDDTQGSKTDEGTNVSNNNLTLASGDQSYVEYNAPYGIIVPPLDLQELDSDQESDISLNGDTYFPPDPPNRGDFFGRFFNLDTFVSLSVCALGIIVTIALTKRR